MSDLDKLMDRLKKRDPQLLFTRDGDHHKCVPNLTSLKHCYFRYCRVSISARCHLSLVMKTKLIAITRRSVSSSGTTTGGLGSWILKAGAKSVMSLACIRSDSTPRYGSAKKTSQTSRPHLTWSPFVQTSLPTTSGPKRSIFQPICDTYTNVTTPVSRATVKRRLITMLRSASWLQKNMRSITKLDDGISCILECIDDSCEYAQIRPSITLWALR